MHRIAIFLRKTENQNKFRDVIRNSLQLPTIDKALLCSGFFQEDKTYSAGRDLDIVALRNHEPLELTSVGVYSHVWKEKYVTFGNEIRTTNHCSCFSFVQKRVPKRGWHAKIFIAKKDKEPLVAIIGSSNVTRRAFSIFKHFNHECDVVIWNELYDDVNAAVESAIAADERREIGTPDVIVAYYDDEHPANRKISLQDRLVALEQEILALAVDL